MLAPPSCGGPELGAVRPFGGGQVNGVCLFLQKGPRSTGR